MREAKMRDGSCEALGRGAIIAGAFVATLITLSGAANDSTATLGTGGLVLTQSADIALDREDLYVSVREVRVRYEFRNVTDHDVAATVAFPLPDIDLAELSEVPVTRPGSDPVNFVDFMVAVDGKSIVPTLETRAVHKGEDVTDYLMGKGLKLSFFADGFYDALLRLSPAQRVEMMGRDLAEYDDLNNVYPLWLVRTAFHWSQVFPADKTVIVEHRYKPVASHFFISKYSLEGDAAELKPYCVDGATWKALWKRIKERSTKGGEEPNDGLVGPRRWTIS
jgi:hypothetical protein